MSLNSSTPSTFDGAVRVLDLGFSVFLLRDKPAEIATLMTERIKLTAKFLARVAGAGHSETLEVVSQALIFPSWHHLSAHLLMPQTLANHGLPARWLDSLSYAALLLAKPKLDLALPATQLTAFERLGEKLSMLADVPIQRVLDGVCAALCAGKSWQEVQTRNSLKTTHSLYTFVLDEADGSAGYFEWSPALHELVEELDDQWQGYDEFTKPEQKRARRWVENALAAQPGFLEAGLALAQMQYDADEPEATATLDRFIRQAEALIPKGFKGQIVWSQLGNRCYHRMLWLRMTMQKARGNWKSVVRLARKQLKLNPSDNLGVRFVLPLTLLVDGDYEAAKKATKGLAGEGMTASVVRAFCEYAVGNRVAFRREL